MIGSRRLKVNRDGYVPIDDLRQINSGRSARARRMDAQYTARKVYPSRVIPEQAEEWMRAPGRSDIEGVDAPRGTATEPKVRTQKVRRAPRRAKGEYSATAWASTERIDDPVARSRAQYAMYAAETMPFNEDMRSRMEDDAYQEVYGDSKWMGDDLAAKAAYRSYMMDDLAMAGSYNAKSGNGGPRLFPIDVDTMARAIAIRGKGESVQELMQMYVDDVSALYEKADRAVANGHPPDVVYALAENYSQRMADYFNGIFRNTVRWHDKGNRVLWTTSNDPIFRKEADALRKMRADFDGMAKTPVAPPRASAPAKARVPKGQGDIIIYGRRKGDKRYQAFDGEGFTNKLIYAMHYPPDRAADVARLVDDLNRMNPGYEFEMRRSKGSMYGGKP